MTRFTDADKAMNYLKKADGSLRMAKIAIGEKEYDSAVMGAVHGAMNVLDALTTSYLGKRASGAHTDVLSLVKGIFSSADYQDVQKQFTSLITMKNASEYQPDLMNDKEAENAVRWAERIINKVKAKLKALT
ncbi:MAG TPA: HEPN domain-containing protein [Nitrososphaera sp.]|nr:HEPN domain-containing protein [Nitrososphaera sp.]